jgi:hypothetical protein
MEIVFLLEREETSGELFKAMSFRSIYGMPMKGERAAGSVGGRQHPHLLGLVLVEPLLVLGGETGICWLAGPNKLVAHRL